MSRFIKGNMVIGNETSCYYRPRPGVMCIVEDPDFLPGIILVRLENEETTYAVKETCFDLYNPAADSETWEALFEWN